MGGASDRPLTPSLSPSLTMPSLQLLLLLLLLWLVCAMRRDATGPWILGPVASPATSVP